MRHRKSGRKFGMDSSARKAMLRNMVTSLMIHGQIKTTEARAKELRRYAERLISIGKRAPTTEQVDALSGDDRQRAGAARVNAIRRIRQVVMHDDAVKMLMGPYADRFRTRPGGYTRVIKLGRPRPGDNSKMAVISLVDEPYEPKAKKVAPEAPAPAVEAGDESVATEDAAETEVTAEAEAPAEESAESDETVADEAVAPSEEAEEKPAE